MIRRGIGFLGGTFDPVHCGHTAIAEAARNALGLVRVDLLPAGAPWQKDLVTPAEHRLAMLRLALDRMPGLGIETIELMRPGATYTIETLAALRRRAGPAMPLVLIIGGDQWRNLHTWKRWRELTDFASIAICRRAGAPLAAEPEVEAWAAEKITPAGELQQHPCGRIGTFGMAPHAASATEVRRAVRALPFPDAMRHLDGWLALPVADYIRRHGLYGAHDGSSAAV